MNTNEETLLAFIGGEPVDGRDLRAAVALMFSAWESVLAAGATISWASSYAEKEKTFTDTVNEIVHWDILLGEYENDTESVDLLPEFLRKRRLKKDFEAQSDRVNK